jgi:excisionase family DNA binding protein
MGSVRLLTVDEVADALKQHKQTVYRLVYGGEMPWVNVAKKGARAAIRIREEDLQAYVAARYTPATKRRAA